MRCSGAPSSPPSLSSSRASAQPASPSRTLSSGWFTHTEVLLFQTFHWIMISVWSKCQRIWTTNRVSTCWKTGWSCGSQPFTTQSTSFHSGCKWSPTYPGYLVRQALCAPPLWWIFKAYVFHNSNNFTDDKYLLFTSCHNH